MVWNCTSPSPLQMPVHCLISLQQRLALEELQHWVTWVEVPAETRCQHEDALIWQKGFTGIA